ncbi:hypothetical protein [Epilithonimonas vandammei]|uniref:hypothetical protein n=1 Tax=Epilithonimonas vandammei TaxID=2487072 RepID=UPI0028AC3359|nr:hypothetical protein [Epilithonimonas vandammei]
MKIRETAIKTFQASIFIGLEKGYTQKRIFEDEVFQTVRRFQLVNSEERNIFLSASISDCNIVLNNQNEPHFKIDFINYPKFPLEESVISLSKELMIKHNQNRMVVVFPDETIMLEQSDEIDPRTAIQ